MKKRLFAIMILTCIMITACAVPGGSTTPGTSVTPGSGSADASPSPSAEQNSDAEAYLLNSMSAAEVVNEIKAAFEITPQKGESVSAFMKRLHVNPGKLNGSYGKYYATYAKFSETGKDCLYRIHYDVYVESDDTFRDKGTAIAVDLYITDVSKAEAVFAGVADWLETKQEKGTDSRDGDNWYTSFTASRGSTYINMAKEDGVYVMKIRLNYTN